MESVDIAGLERRAKRAYELARVRQALWGIAPVFVVVAVAACVGGPFMTTVVLGVGLITLAALLFWYGHEPGRAVGPGLLAGLLPLGLALCANSVGHACLGDECMMLCLPACAIGGVAAGVVTARHGIRRKLGAWYWLTASTVAILTGALGCSCVGYAGIAGLVAGYAVGVGPGLVASVVRRRQ